MAKRKKRRLTTRAKIMLLMVAAIVLIIFAFALIQSSYTVYFDAHYQKEYVITTKLKALGWIPALMGVCLIPTIYNLLRKAYVIKKEAERKRRERARRRRQRRLNSK